VPPWWNTVQVLTQVIILFKYDYWDLFASSLFSIVLKKKFCVWYFAILQLCSGHFRAYSTFFNPGEVHLYHIIGFYVTSINFQILQLGRKEAFHPGTQKNISLWPRFPVSLCPSFNSNFVSSSEIVILHHQYLVLCILYLKMCSSIDVAFNFTFTVWQSVVDAEETQL
jgi:hypothetical protein